MPQSKSLGQAGVVIDAPGAAEFSRRLQRWGTRIEDARAEFELVIREVLRPGEAQTFDTEGAALGQAWKQAAEPERKRDARLLRMSGALYRSLASQTSDSVQEATATELHFSTRVPYAHFHQYGIPGRLPARPFVGISQASRKRIVDVMHRLSVLTAEGAE